MTERPKQDDIFFEALKTRDARFDGRFFTGVLSTGIFCRPVCPALTPRYENCRFFDTAAAAVSHGFRPCLRCRPETAPASPAWKGTETTVRRAMRLIEQGALDGNARIGDLAGRLGVGERHLRRLFMQHLGASPKETALTRRLLFAKKLLSDTSMSITEIAHASGFSSLRRFNDAFLKLYGRAPSSVRRPKNGCSGKPDGHFLVTLPVRMPFHHAALMDFYAGRAIPGVEWFEGATYWRTVRVGNDAGKIAINWDGDHQVLRLRVDVPSATGLLETTEKVRRIFDVDADSPAIASHLGSDPLLANAVAALPGLRVPGAWDPFELCVRAVLGQQITVKAARTIAGRIVARCADALPGQPERLLFPTPQTLLETDLSGLGLTGRRITTLKAVSEAFTNGLWDRLEALSPDDAVRELENLPGIGPWTARYVALRALGDPDSFPPGDVGLERISGLSRKDLIAHSETWRPWRAYAVLYLWSSETLEDPQK